MFSAGILGFCVGMVTILLVTVQFYLFIELEWEIEFPYYLFLGMVLISIVTTYLSVYIPMRTVNTRPIASALKASSQ